MKTTTMKKTKSGPTEAKAGDSPSQLIDARIKELSDWRGETLARVRILIKQADPEVVEERKWRGVPVWSHAGIICTGETATPGRPGFTAANKSTAGASSPTQCTRPAA